MLARVEMANWLCLYSYTITAMWHKVYNTELVLFTNHNHIMIVVTTVRQIYNIIDIVESDIQFKSLSMVVGQAWIV